MPTVKTPQQLLQPQSGLIVQIRQMVEMARRDLQRQAAINHMFDGSYGSFLSTFLMILRRCSSIC